ncbi:hypothetical protein EMCRGX_G010284 [Ephydatia muelleri]
MDTLFADVNDSEDPFAEQRSTQEPKEGQDTTSATHQTAGCGHNPNTTPKEGTQLDEDEMMYSAELTYEQRKELRLKKRNKKATEEPKPSKPPKPAHLTKEAIQKAAQSPRLAPKKPHEDKRSSPVPPAKFASHRKEQQTTVAHSTSNARPANGSKATGHTHLERQNQQLSDELAKLRDEASRLEKKLKEKDHIISELKVEISSLEDDADEKIATDNSGTEEQQRRSSDHHNDDSGNDTQGNSTPESDHQGDRHDVQSPDDSNQVKHDVDHHGDHGNHEHVHHADHSESSSGRHGHQKASGHGTHKGSHEATMSNPWKASKKSHMV